MAWPKNWELVIWWLLSFNLVWIWEAINSWWILIIHIFGWILDRGQLLTRWWLNDIKKLTLLEHILPGSCLWCKKSAYKSSPRCRHPRLRTWKKGFKKLKKVTIWLYLIGRPDDMLIPLMNSISLNKKDIAIEGFQRTMVHIQLVPSRLPFNYVRHCFTSSVLCFWLFLELFVSCIFHSFYACLFFVCTLFLLQRFVSSSSLLCGFFVRSSLSVQFVSEKIGKGEFLKI